MKKLRLLSSLPLMFALIFLFGFEHQTYAQTETLNVEFEITERPVLIKGSVIDSETGAAIEWVSVFLLDERNETLTNASGKVSGVPTDEKGKYHLALTKTDSLIVFRKTGYEPIIHAFKGEKEVHIKLIKTPAPNKEGND